MPPQFLDDLIRAGSKVVVGIYDERDASQRQNDLREPETGFTVQLNLIFHDILLAKEKTQPRCAAGIEPLQVPCVVGEILEIGNRSILMELMKLFLA